MTEEQLAVAPCQVYGEVLRTLCKWREMKVANAHALQRWRDGLPASKKNVVGCLDPFLLKSMIQEAGHVHMELPEDLLAGLPLTDVLGVGGSGVDIPGGQRVHGKPGGGGPLPLSQLREQCVSVNHATICAAKAREYSSELDSALAL